MTRPHALLIALLLASYALGPVDPDEAASAIGGSAVCQIANCNYTKIPTGTGWAKSNWNIQ